MFGRLQETLHVATEETLVKIQTPEAMSVGPLGNKER